MPTYEFRCPQGHEFEKFYRSIGGAEAQAACPVCDARSERMMSATGFAFKGSGFYLTDYGKNAHREKGTAAPVASGSGEGGTAASEKGIGSTSESKPEAKGDASKGSDASGGADTRKAAPVAEAKPAPTPKPKPKQSSSE